MFRQGLLEFRQGQLILRVLDRFLKGAQIRRLKIDQILFGLLQAMIRLRDRFVGRGDSQRCRRRPEIRQGLFGRLQIAVRLIQRLLIRRRIDGCQNLARLHGIARLDVQAHQLGRVRHPLEGQVRALHRIELTHHGDGRIQISPLDIHDLCETAAGRCARRGGGTAPVKPQAAGCQQEHQHRQPETKNPLHGTASQCANQTSSYWGVEPQPKPPEGSAPYNAKIDRLLCGLRSGRGSRPASAKASCRRHLHRTCRDNAVGALAARDDHRLPGCQVGQLDRGLLFDQGRVGDFHLGLLAVVVLDDENIVTDAVDLAENAALPAGACVRTRLALAGAVRGGEPALPSRSECGLRLILAVHCAAEKTAPGDQKQYYDAQDDPNCTFHFVLPSLVIS